MPTDAAVMQWLAQFAQVSESREILDRLEPVSTLLLPVFFVTTGLGVDIGGIGIDGLGVLALVLIVAMAGIRIVPQARAGIVEVGHLGAEGPVDLGRDRAAEPVAGLEQRDPEPGAFETVGEGEAGDARAEDGHGLAACTQGDRPPVELHRERIFDEAFEVAVPTNS